MFLFMWGYLAITCMDLHSHAHLQTYTHTHTYITHRVLTLYGVPLSYCRCFFIAQSYVVVKKWSEALVLYERVLKYAREVLSKAKSLDNSLKVNDAYTYTRTLMHTQHWYACIWVCTLTCTDTYCYCIHSTKVSTGKVTCFLYFLIFDPGLFRLVCEQHANVPQQHLVIS